MMIYLKYAKWIGIGIILFLAFIALPYFYNKTQKLKADNEELVKYSNAQDDVNKIYLNKLNQQVTETQTLRLSQKNMAALQEDFKDLSDKFEGIKKNLKNVENVTRMTVEAVGNFEIPTSEPRIDTTLNESVRDFDNGDQWMRVKGRITDQRILIDTLSVPVPIDLVTYWRRKKILFLRIGRKEYSTSATSENPYVKITNLKSVVKRK